MRYRAADPIIAVGFRIIGGNAGGPDLNRWADHLQGAIKIFQRQSSSTGIGVGPAFGEIEHVDINVDVNVTDALRQLADSSAQAREIVWPHAGDTALLQMGRFF